MSVTRSVQRGAALLDRYCPDWYTKVNPATLNIQSNKYCILGQVYGKFNEGLSQLHILWPPKYGFIAFYYTEQLEDEWRNVIASRRIEAQYKERVTNSKSQVHTFA